MMPGWPPTVSRWKACHTTAQILLRRELTAGIFGKKPPRQPFGDKSSALFRLDSPRDLSRNTVLAMCRPKEELPFSNAAVGYPITNQFLLHDYPSGSRSEFLVI